MSRSLSFREQAAIALRTQHSNNGCVLYGTADAVEVAGKLAVAACKAWGHVWPGKQELLEDDTCDRCGIRVIELVPEDAGAK